MKSKPTSPKLSVTEAAWGAFLSQHPVDDLDVLRAEGWRTVQDVAEALGQSRAAADCVLRRSPQMERREIRAPVNGVVRRMNIFRPRV